MNYQTFSKSVRLCGSRLFRLALVGVLVGTGMLGVKAAEPRADVPLQLLDGWMAEGVFSLEWQGNSNALFTIETADRLDVSNAFVPSVTNIPSNGAVNSFAYPPGPDEKQFYRIVEENGSSSNRFGRVVFFSDLHMSPFASASIVEQLMTAEVEQWELIFSAATNGYYTADASEVAATTPMLYASALSNAVAVCPRPDAVLFLGDFRYYDFWDLYADVTGDPNPNNWKILSIKMLEYILYQANQAYPDVPVYCVLGNNDTFLEDYDITVGDPYLATSAPAFFQYGLSGVTDFASFSATFTNAGNYSAPFGGGEIIALETTFFSPKYPGDMSAGSNQLAYLETRLAACSASETPVWVLQHIPPGVNAFETWQHWETGQTTVAQSDWKEPFVKQYNQLIAEYRDTVSGIFCGHYHNRGWEIANDPATSNATVGIQIMNGLLFNHDNNSGFTVMTYDRDTLVPVRETSYNLDYDEHIGQTQAVFWNDRYSMNEAYGIPDFTAESLLLAWSQMADAGSSGFEAYRSQYNGGRQPFSIRTNQWPVYHGVIRWLQEDQFLQNTVP
jgi:sphingomyelin phosphodiesterase acid-like 3